MRAPCGWLPVHAGFLSHTRAVWVRCEGTWWLVSCVMKTQWKLVPSHMATLTLQVLFGRPIMWNYFRTQVINRGRLRLVAPSNNQPFRHCHCLIPLNCIFSLSLLFLALSVSSAFSPCCSLSLIFFFLLLHSAHFSRTPFPSWSQATKYSDWWRQLCFITNCKRSRGAADERREDLWFVRQLNPC